MIALHSSIQRVLFQSSVVRNHNFDWTAEAEGIIELRSFADRWLAEQSSDAALKAEPHAE